MKDKKALPDFLISNRKGSNTWAQNSKNIEAWRNGLLLDVKPMNLEFAPVLACDMSCPGCPFGKSRKLTRNGRVKTNEYAKLDHINGATRKTAKKVLEESVKAGVKSVLWTGGGEPLIWEPLIEMIRYSANLGLINCLYTNGVRLGTHPEIVHELMKPEMKMAFIRVSINAVTPRTVRRHWGVKDPNDLYPQQDGLYNLFLERENKLIEYDKKNVNPPSIQVSTIIDKTNVSDLFLICETIAKIIKKSNARLTDEDVIVVRPMTNHRNKLYSTTDHDDFVINEIINICGKNGKGYKVLKNAGMTTYLGFGLNQIASGKANSYTEILQKEYESRDLAWANGLFLTVGPDGSAYICTEHNCDPKWAIGNLNTQTVDEIYHSEKRKRILDLIHSYRLGPEVFEPNTRASRLDKIARLIRSGKLQDEQIEHIRQLSLDEPSLLLS